MEYAESIGKVFNIKWISKSLTDDKYVKICISNNVYCYAFSDYVQSIIRTDDMFELNSYIITNWIKTFDYTVIRHGIYRDKIYGDNIISKCLISFDMKINYIGRIYRDPELREFSIVLDDAGEYKEMQDIPYNLPDNLPEFKSKKEYERHIRVDNINPHRRYWPNPKLQGYTFPNASWYLTMAKYGIANDNDILGIEYKKRGDGSHDSHLLDLLLRMEMPLYFIKKLLKHYDSENMSISEMVEDILYKILGGDVDLDTIVKMERPSRSNVYDHKFEEHITDLPFVSIKVDCEQTYPSGYVSW